MTQQNPFEIIDSRLKNIEEMLLDLKHSPKFPSSEITSTDQFLTIHQAADFLCLSVPTIYSLVSRRSIPYCKKGKRLYFSKSDLISWVKSGRKKTMVEISQSAEQFLTPKKK